VRELKEVGSRGSDFYFHTIFKDSRDIKVCPLAIIEYRHAESKTERLRNSISGYGKQRKRASSLWLLK